MADPTKSEIVQIAQGYLEQELKANESATLTPFEDGDYGGPYQADQWKQEHIALKEKIGDSFYDEQLTGLVGELLSKKGFEAGEIDSEPYQLACHYVLRAQAEVARIMVAKFSGNHIEAVVKDPHLTVTSGSGAGSYDDATSPAIGEIVKTFIEFKSKGAWTYKTELDNKRTLNWFLEIVGLDKPIGKIVIDDIKDFRNALIQVPKNYVKIKKFDGLSFHQVLMAGKGDQKISQKTAKKYLGIVKAMFGWCVEEGFLKEIPGATIKVPYHDSPEDARHSYSKKQLERLLASPLYTGHTKHSRSKTGDLLIQDGRYWIPLISLLSAARAGEIVQLYADDIIEIDGICCFDINAVKGKKTVKSKSSVRRIPISSTLINLGFMEFVEDQRKKSKSGRLFEEFPVNATSAANAFSKWYRRFSNQIKIYAPKTPFHSLRHVFKDALVQGGAPEYVIKAILGHKDTSVTGTYGSGVPVKLQQEWIEKASLGVSFDHLKPYKDKKAPVDESA